MHPVGVEPVPPTASARRTVGPAARALLKNPLALSQALVYHHRMRRFRLPQDALEGWHISGRKWKAAPTSRRVPRSWRSSSTQPSPIRIGRSPSTLSWYAAPEFGAESREGAPSSPVHNSLTLKVVPQMGTLSGIQRIKGISALDREFWPASETKWATTGVMVRTH